MTTLLMQKTYPSDPVDFAETRKKAYQILNNNLQSLASAPIYYPSKAELELLNQAQGGIDPVSKLYTVEGVIARIKVSQYVHDVTMLYKDANSVSLRIELKTVRRGFTETLCEEFEVIKSVLSKTDIEKINITCVMKEVISGAKSPQG